DLVGWNWKTSQGFFTFGGTGTNLYGLKLAINNVDPDAKMNGIKQNNYFILTSKNGHPCHYQLCDWLGLGQSSGIEVKSDKFGRIDVEDAEKIIHENIAKGKMFLGFNLTGGSTNEMAIDPVKQIYDLNAKIAKQYNLNYKPYIHIDSVLGWVFLFFKDYDFSTNNLNIDKQTINKIKSLTLKAVEFEYADSMGIDFHKTGYCPYSTSMVLIKDKKQYEKLGDYKIKDLESMHYGDYNPYQTGLEYSRSCHGPISALACLKSLGKDGFRQLVINICSVSTYFREKLELNNLIRLVDEGNEGYAIMFIILPEIYSKLSLDEIKKLGDKEIEEIREYNIGFGKYILSKAVAKEINFFFTSSRSYLIQGTNIKIGALKAYSMSVFLTNQCIDNLLKELSVCIADYDCNKNTSTKIVKEVFSDMTCDDSKK
ncbi:MAG: hypothetical protein CVV63_01495, partial [Tenericutes bacterium HGW-Tenericutes-8]